MKKKNKEKIKKKKDWRGERNDVPCPVTFHAEGRSLKITSVSVEWAMKLFFGGVKYV